MPEEIDAWANALGEYGDLAANLWAMYSAFIAQGFSEEQSMLMTNAYFMKQLELHAMRNMLTQQGEDPNATQS